MHEDEHAELRGLGPERIVLRRATDPRPSRGRRSTRRAGPSCLTPSSSCSAARSGCCSATDASATKRSGCAATHFASPSFCAWTIRRARSRSAVVPPVAIDAERLDIDALLIHDLQTLRAEDVVPAPPPALASGVPLTISATGMTQCAVHVDHSDAAATHHHLASRRLSLKRGGRCVGTASAHHIRARRSSHDRPEEIPAIWHVPPLLFCPSNDASTREGDVAV